MEVARSNARIAWAITGSPAIAANNLSNPMRWLLPPATMMALSMAQKRNAQRPTSNVQSRNQNAAIRR
jgi:hypothetical protein